MEKLPVFLESEMFLFKTSILGNLTQNIEKFDYIKYMYF